MLFKLLYPSVRAILAKQRQPFARGPATYGWKEALNQFGATQASSPPGRFDIM